MNMTLEKEIERKLKDVVEDNGGLCLKWTCPGWKGVPDRIVLLPGGHVIFVETKRPIGGRLSSMQEWWRSRLKGLGFNYYVVWNEIDLQIFEAIIGREGEL